MGIVIAMRGRSRMIKGPCIPTMPGRSTPGFYRPGRHGVHQARSAVRCSASSIKGGLHPISNHLWGGERGVIIRSRLTVLRRTGSGGGRGVLLPCMAGILATVDPRILAMPGWKGANC